MTKKSSILWSALNFEVATVYRENLEVKMFCCFCGLAHSPEILAT